jgi:hypothetical protein
LRADFLMGHHRHHGDWHLQYQLLGSAPQADEQGVELTTASKGILFVHHVFEPLPRLRGSTVAQRTS